MAKTEHILGLKASRESMPALRERWPAAFPLADRKIRPLANITEVIAKEMGWTVKFTHGVLAGWKSCAAYCRAVLRHSERINLDCTPSGALVDDKARAMATAQLAAIKARREKKAAERTAATAPAEQVPPIEPPKPPPMPPPPPPPMIVLETPEQIRAHLRASLLKRRSAPEGASAAP
jgi:sRNA-binding protein